MLCVVDEGYRYRSTPSKYYGLGTGSSSTHRGIGTGSSFDARAPPATENGGGTNFRFVVPSMASHVELQRALEPLDGDTSSLSPGRYGNAYLDGGGASSDYLDDLPDYHVLANASSLMAILNPRRQTYTFPITSSTRTTTYYKRH